MNKKNSRKIIPSTFTISIVIPVIILCIIFISKGITPFGPNTLLSGDLNGQYTNLYTELCNKLKNGNSLLFSWTRGLGIDYISECSYYNITPANLIYIFFNNRTMPTAISLSVIIKCAFASLCMCIYLTKHYQKQLSSAKDGHFQLFILSLSCCYALCSYFVNYLTNIIWIDAFLIFPLIMLSLEMLVHNQKPYLYTIALCFCILSNFYIGYMICLFCIIYFIYLIFTSEYDASVKKFIFILKASGRFSLYSLFAGLLCSFILIPTIYIIGSTDAGTFGFYKQISMYYSSIVSFFRQMMSANPTYWHHPYIYSTVLSFLLIPLFFVNSSIPLKNRIGKGIVYLFMLLSFQLNILDFVWNGFHLVNCFAGRQSFVFIFLVLTMLADIFLAGIPNKKCIITSYILTLCLFLIVNFQFDYSATFKCILKNILILTLYLIIVIIIKNRITKNFGIKLLVLFMSFELLWSSYERIDVGIKYSDYNKNIDNTESAFTFINDNSFYRIKNTVKINKNTAALCNYNGISTYSSLTNSKLSDLLYKTGFCVSLNAFDDVSWEPVFSSIIGTKYIIDKNEYAKTDILTLIKTIRANTYSKDMSFANSDNIYLYKNEFSLNPAFLVNKNIKDFDFDNHVNPFELINSFAHSIADCENIYEVVPIIDGRLSVNEGEQLYLYSKQNFQDYSFEYTDGEEKLYSNNYSEIKLTRIPYSDDYIYYVYSSPYGGVINIPTDLPNDNDESKKLTIYDTNKYIAYKLNFDNFKKLMSVLSHNQIKISTYDDTHINGSINADYSGTVMTSIPFSNGWTVKVDGKKVKTFSIHDAFLAFDIEDGTHDIQMTYFPEGLLPGIIISTTTLIIFIFAGLLHIRYNRTKKTAA